MADSQASPTLRPTSAVAVLGAQGLGRMTLRASGGGKVDDFVGWMNFLGGYRL